MRTTSVARVGTSYACFDFFIQKSQSLAPLFLLFAKGRVQVGYSLVNALITPLFHYQPFARVPTAQVDREVITRRSRSSGYLLVNALITPLFHYQPFASVLTA